MLGLLSRRRTSENKESNVLFGIINITCPARVTVENIIPAPRLIITFLGMIFSTITRAGNVIFLYYYTSHIIPM